MTVSGLLLVDSATMLTQLVDRLLAQHRAGLTPTFGQVEDLVDLNARVKQDLVLARVRSVDREEHVARLTAALARVQAAVNSVHSTNGTEAGGRVQRECAAEGSAK